MASSSNELKEVTEIPDPNANEVIRLEAELLGLTSFADLLGRKLAVYSVLDKTTFYFICGSLELYASGVEISIPCTEHGDMQKYASVRFHASTNEWTLSCRRTWETEDRRIPKAILTLRP